jgi:hypothetical protein
MQAYRLCSASQILISLCLASFARGASFSNHTTFGNRRLNAPTIDAVRIDFTRSMNSVGWRLHDIMHEPALCIHPAPFGNQCTVHRQSAIASCLALQCKSVICPDQKPYIKGKPKKGIRGAICQLRNHDVENEPRHGMCTPTGCTHWSFVRKPLLELLRAEDVAQLQFPLGEIALVLVLPERMIQYECHDSERMSTRPFPGSPEACGCFDAGPLKVASRVLMQSEPGLICVLRTR